MAVPVSDNSGAQLRGDLRTLFEAGQVPEGERIGSV
jgi:hypothetical protein